MRNGLPRIKDPLTTLLSRSACVLCALLFLAFNCYAQSEGQTIPHRGFQPTDSYSLGSIETINTTSGNLMLNIPLASLPPGRGGSPGFQLGLHYNSKIWNGQADVVEDPNHSNQTVEITRIVHSTQGGWAYNLKSYSVFAYNRNSGGVTYPINDCRHNNIWMLKVTFPDGGTHEFRPYGYDDPCDDGYFGVQASSAMTYYSIDGTYARLVYDQTGWTLSFADGTHVVNQPGSQRSYDRNGNYTEIQSVTNYNNTGHDAKVITDQLGRFMAVEFGVGEDYVHATGFNGEPLTTTVKWTSTYVKKTYRAGNHFQYNLDINNAGVGGVGEVILPAQVGANLKYSFGYNGWPTSGNPTPSVGWGELSSVTLPSGARADYQYEMDNHSGSGQQADLVLKNAPTQKELNYNLEYDGSVVAAPTERWLYSISETYAQITSPDGGITKEWFTDTDLPGGGLVYKTESPDGSVLEKVWKENRPYLPPAVTIWVGERVNSYVSKEFASVRDAAGNLVKTAIKEYRHDKNGNEVQQFEYDWAPYSSVLRDGSNNPLGTIPGDAQLKRLKTINYLAATPDASDTTTNDPESYDKASAPLLRVAVAAAEIGDGSQVLARTECFYDNEFTTGNLIEQRSWDSTTGGYISVSHQYDGYFNRTLSTDAGGHQTKFTYGTVGAFTDLYPTEIISAFDAGIKRTMRQTFDFSTGLVTQTTDVDNNVSSETDYDVFGRAKETRAAANVASAKTVTRVEYSAVDRRVIARSDLNVAYDGKLVSIQHYDQLGRVRLARQLEDSATQDPYNETQGIKVQTRYKYSDVNTYQVSSQPYREAASSQAPPTAMGWSRAKADNGGRLMESQQFGGNTLPAPWSSNTTGTGQVLSTYDANTTTVMDQAGKVRRSVRDGLGRLVRVDEPDQNNNLDVGGVPFQSTSYTYDALDNLTSVSQGTQTRTFVYDSLKRLSSATNPEGGRVCYGTVTSAGQCQANGYDANGNLIHKTDARGVLSTYAYDELNRNISVTYTGDPASTPSVTRIYDGATNGKGRLWKTETEGDRGSLTTINSYDFLGRPTSQSQQFYDGDWSNPFTVSATYDKAGHVLKQTYPSTHTVDYSYDSAGRTFGMTGNLGDNVVRNYSTEIVYSAMGAMTKEKFGATTPVFNKLYYNSRGQLGEIRESTTSATDTSFDRGAIINHYSNNDCWGASCNAPDNNGNLMKQEIHIQDAQGNDTMRWQQYEYDSLNRLSWVREISGSAEIWRQTFVYDRYGNRTIDQDVVKTYGTGINKKEFTVNVTNKNRLGVPSGQTGVMEYDDAGNLVSDTYSGLGSYLYDAENRLTEASPAPVCYPDGEGGQTCNPGGYGSNDYVYDGDGRRVRRIIGGALVPDETWQVYGMGGELLAEYAANAAPVTIKKEYGYRNGVLLVTGQKNAGNLNLEWLVSDQLGTPRMVIDKTGSLAGVSRHDYLPFGEELSAGTGDRTTTMGYSAADGVRQKFTSKERDNETGLDYFGARYLSSTLGRFISVDPALTSASVVTPQSWNRYAYSFNNPLKYSDPTGAWNWSAALGGSESDDCLLAEAETEEQKKIAQAIVKQRTLFRTALAAATAAGASSDEPDVVARAVKSFGKANDNNGVTVTFGTTKSGSVADAGPSANGGLSFDANGTATAQVTVTISNSASTNTNSLSQAIGHEGSHVADRQGFATYLTGQIQAAGGLNNFIGTPREAAAFNSPYNRTVQTTELNAYIVSGLIAQGRDALGNHFPNSNFNGHEVWNNSWSAAERPGLRAVGAFEHVTTSDQYAGRLNERMFQP